MSSLGKKLIQAANEGIDIARNRYIGPDPLKWIDRLLDVNEKADWPQWAKDVIDKRLCDAYDEIEKAVGLG